MEKALFYESYNSVSYRSSSESDEGYALQVVIRVNDVKHWKQPF